MADPHTTATWLIKILKAERDAHYIWITLEYLCQALTPVEFRPEVVMLVCAGGSPLRGLARAPVLYHDTQCTKPVPVTDKSPVLRLVPGERRRAALAFAAQGACVEFGLYVPGCEVMNIQIIDQLKAKTD